MNEITDINIIEILKQALRFYADKDNYIKGNEKILLDNGTQAQFALDKANEIESIFDKLKIEYLNDIVGDSKSFEEEKPDVNIIDGDSWMNLVNKIKNL